MTNAPQSSPAFRRLPACVGLFWLCLCLVQPSWGQTRRAEGETEFYNEPQGSLLATIARGTPLDEAGSNRNGWLQVTLEGWIFTASTEPTSRGDFERVVSVSGGENLRAEPNGHILARVEEGMLLNRLGTRGGWTRVSRTGWVRESATTSSATGAAPDREEPEETGGSRAEHAIEPGHAETARPTPILAAPGGDSIGTLRPAAPARTLSRSGEWVRVQVEGWVRESDLRTAPEGVLVGVTAAEVRANPERYVGRTVQWRVQAIAVRVADELRPEIPAGQPYLLARGPLPESGFVYVVVPEDQAERFRSLPPLEELLIRAVVREPRTKYLPTPVVELVGVLEE